jgi:hypothetical protein
MKNTFKTLVLAMLVFPYLSHANGGQSYDFSRSTTVNGQQQKYQSGLSLSNFSDDQYLNMVSTKIYNMISGWKVTPQSSYQQFDDEYSLIPYRMPLHANSLPADDPGVTSLFKEVLDLYGKTVYKYGNSSAVGTGILPAMWVADAYRAGLLDKNAYLYNFRQCLAMAPQRILGSNFAGSMLNVEPTKCLIGSYVMTYGVSQNGFPSGNLLPLIPLCEVAQGNSCGIDIGWDNRKNEISNQKKASFEKAKADLPKHFVTIHEQSVATYKRLTGREPEVTFEHGSSYPKD